MIEPLEKYHEIFKQKKVSREEYRRSIVVPFLVIKEVLQKSRSKHRKDVEEREKLERKNHRYPSDHQGVATAQNSVRYAQNESHHSQIILHDELLQFEQMKLDDIKVSLSSILIGESLSSV